MISSMEILLTIYVIGVAYYLYSSLNDVPEEKFDPYLCGGIAFMWPFFVAYYYIQKWNNR